MDLIEVSKVAILEAYDRLPPRLRELYDQAPVPLNPWEFYEVFQESGELGACYRLYEAIQQLFPTWSPIYKRKKGEYK